MTDSSSAEEVNFYAPARKAKRKARSAAPAKPPAPFPGLTRTACADACGADGCAISGRNYCAHPAKGGLQPVDMHSKAALARLDAARDDLARADLEAGLAKRKN